MSTLSKPRITVLMFGGTIAMQASGAGGVTPAITGETLVAALGPAADAFTLAVETVRLIPSANLGLADVETMLERIDAAKAAGGDGVVIMLGTDTLEEIAFALNLTAADGIGVVLTGAMRNPTLPGADGAANLLSALRVAAAPMAKTCGPVVVMNDEIHAARLVHKAHTSSPQAFVSGPLGPIGWVAEGRPRWFTLPVRGEPIALDIGNAKRVGLITTWMDDDGVLVEAAIAAGLDGLVIEAFGTGHLSERVARIAAQAAAKAPVVLASCTGQGEVARNTYGFEGGEITLIRDGLIPAGPLSGRKARLLLKLLLQSGADAAAVRAAFSAL